MLKSFVDKISDNKNSRSLAHSYRSKRFELFKELLNKMPKPIQILDLGGTVDFWQAMNFNENDVTITLLNLISVESVPAPFLSVKGDATNLNGIADQSYDIVFSNSVIEHLFTWENQQKMAAEIMRVGKKHFIQSPNYWFPVEPHWVFPFFQYFPKKLRVYMTQHYTLGHIGKIYNSNEAERQVEEIRLLTRKEYAQLFPQSKIFEEKFIGITKSFIAISN